MFIQKVSMPETSANVHQSTNQHDPIRKEKLEIKFSIQKEKMKFSIKKKKFLIYKNKNLK